MASIPININKFKAHAKVEIDINTNVNNMEEVINTICDTLQCNLTGEQTEVEVTVKELEVKRPETVNVNIEVD
jgi:hypothetical protein